MSAQVKPIDAATGRRPANVSQDEWDLRIKLAAAYRVFDFLGWTELIYNHITVRVPGPETHFLINPFGMHYREVTASSLVKIDLDGNVVGPSNWPVNPAGFVIHSAIHGAVPDAHCVMHIHTVPGMAVAAAASGLTPTSFYAAQLHDMIAYHDFEGITVVPDEKSRLLKSLGNKKIMILRSHGLLTLGKTIPEAFLYMWNLYRACEIQLASGSLGDLIRIPEEVCKVTTQQAYTFNPAVGLGEDSFGALVRLVDARDPSYRS